MIKKFFVALVSFFAIAVLSAYNPAHVNAILRDKLHCPGCDFRGAPLAGANLQALDLRGSDFERADLRKVNFNGAYLEGANFKNVNAQEAMFGTTLLNRHPYTGVPADFTNAHLARANFNNAHLHDALFYNADLTEASFVFSDLTRAQFPFAIINGAIFTGALLYYANFYKAIGSAGTMFIGIMQYDPRTCCTRMQDGKIQSNPDFCSAQERAACPSHIVDTTTLIPMDHSQP